MLDVITTIEETYFACRVPLGASDRPTNLALVLLSFIVRIKRSWDYMSMILTGLEQETARDDENFASVWAR